MSAPYTLRHLPGIENVAPKFGLGEIQETRFAREELGAEHTGVCHQRLKPGKRQAFGHRHDDAEEVYVALRGSGRVKLDDEILELRPLDALRVSPSVMRSFEAGPDGLELLVFGPHRPGDGELVQDWWRD